MSTSASSCSTDLQHSPQRSVECENDKLDSSGAPTALLRAALEHEQALLLKKSDLLQRQEAMAQEFEHRLNNSLQMISSMLTLQCRTATTPEAIAQLSFAARRVSSVGHVHRRLHAVDHQESVELTQYLQGLCDDLADLLFHDPASRVIIVQSTPLEIPTKLGIPLGFIVNELVTNATKYTTGNITVRIETTIRGYHSLSVLDDGPGLPADFDPAKSTGLGMKIVLLLVKQLGGELHVLPGDSGRGSRFTITFSSVA